MYLTKTLTAAVEAAQAYFAEEARPAEWRDLHIGVDYPVNVQQYPGVWIDWEPGDRLEVSSISAREYQKDTLRRLERWRFGGYLTFTVYALNSLERARLHDEVVSMLTEGRLRPEYSTFRSHLEDNDLIAINVNLDQIASRAMITTTSTPWGSDDNIYEVTLAITVIGEYLTDPADPADGLVSRVDVYPYTDDEGDPFVGQSDGEEGWF